MTASDPAREAFVARLRPQTTGWPDDLLDPSRPTFLARPRPGGHVSWYGIAHSPRQARGLREHLLAFVGPSHSDFAGQPAEWDRADPFEAELAAAFPYGFRLAVRPADAGVVLKLITRLRQLLRERPARERAAPPLLGRLLRDFELLVRAGDCPGATAVLDTLRHRGQLTTDQFAGLNLRLLAGQERWSEVLSAPELPSLVTQRLPVAVAEAVAAAVFHEHLARYATESEATEHFREQVQPAYGLLFRQRAAWRHPDAVKAAVIADASVRAAAPLTPAAPPADLITAAAEAHRANDSETAFQLLLRSPFTPDSLRLLVEVALDLGTREVARAATAAVNGCPAPIRAQAFARRASQALWNELEEVAGDLDSDSPSDWLAWLSRAAAGPWPDAAEAAARGLGDWPRPDPAAFNADFHGRKPPHISQVIASTFPQNLRISGGPV